jgi:hypothetical protein
MFFLFWGKKAVSRKIGYVADFCPICRDIRGFQLNRLGMSGHLYGAALGEGALIGHHKKCLTCMSELPTDASIYKDVLTGPPNAALPELVAATFPKIRDHYSERLAAEERLLNGSVEVEPDTRSTMIKEPFFLLSPTVEKRFGAVHIDRQVGISLIVTFLTALVLPNLLEAIFSLGFEAKQKIALTILGLGVSAVSIYGFTSGGRFLRTHIYPKLSLALHPLRPTQTELDNVLAELRRLDLTIARKIKASTLLRTSSQVK